jgi:hypothetical protein
MGLAPRRESIDCAPQHIPEFDGRCVNGLLVALVLKRDTFLGSAAWPNRRNPPLGASSAMTKEQERELRANLARLLQEHRDLDVAIEALQNTPGADVLQVQRLKKRKLQLRDRITFIEDQLTPDIIA